MIASIKSNKLTASSPNARTVLGYVLGDIVNNILLTSSEPATSALAKRFGSCSVNLIEANYFSALAPTVRSLGVAMKCKLFFADIPYGLTQESWDTKFELGNIISLMKAVSTCSVASANICLILMLSMEQLAEVYAAYLAKNPGIPFAKLVPFIWHKTNVGNSGGNRFNFLTEGCLFCFSQSDQAYDWNAEYFQPDFALRGNIFSCGTAKCYAPNQVVRS